MPFLEANKKRIAYKDWAPKSEGSSKETIVLLHGLGSSQNFYTGVVLSLTTHGYRCICLDTTGQGLSPYTFYEQTTASLAADVIGVMDALSVKEAVVVGHSMSAGLTGPWIAAEYPDRVTSLILLGPPFPSEQLEATFLDRVDKVSKGGIEAMADVIPFAALGSAATPLMRAMARQLVYASDPDGYISLCRLIAFSHKTPPAYAKIKCPTLVVAGEEDKSAPLEGCKKLFDALTSSSKKDLIVQKKIGHWMSIEGPETTASDILKWIS